MHGIRGLNATSIARWSPIARSLFEHKRRVAQLRFQRIQPVKRLAEIFRAMHGDYSAPRPVSIGEASLYQPAETFEEFLRINGIPVYEEVLR